MTPRPYLSWTQLDLWEKSPDRYKQTYIYDDKMRPNMGMSFGKIMADALETGDTTGDAILDLVIAKIPKFGVMECELDAEIKDGKNTIKLFSKIDTAKRTLSAFKEYKTGQAEWTKSKANDFGQITFYATAIFLKTGKIPKDIELVHVPTKKGNNGQIEATGEILRYTTTRDMIDILRMIVRIKKAWAGIEAMCEEELL